MTFFSFCKRKEYLSRLQKLVPYFQLLWAITQGTREAFSLLFPGGGGGGVRPGRGGQRLVHRPQTRAVPTVLLEILGSNIVCDSLAPRLDQQSVLEAGREKQGFGVRRPGIIPAALCPSCVTFWK